LSEAIDVEKEREKGRERKELKLVHSLVLPFALISSTSPSSSFHLLRTQAERVSEKFEHKKINE
jgi:hypothetical protein